MRDSFSKKIKRLETGGIFMCLWVFDQVFIAMECDLLI